ncbi:MAG: 1,4-dihydroxy-6-naphthoate synthase [Desulfovibrionaceae bacterium]|nr:1,4-dihydroxy-6-naphthoate synthase [Desulfovibrionaceae bacterium]
MQTLSLGISPCPNDTFIFHALLFGIAPSPENIRPHLQDVEELNSLALRGELDVTKLSIGVLPFVLDEYVLLRSGGALGFGVGPLLAAREPLNVADCRNLPVAVPGRFTTANLLLELHGAFQGPRKEMAFDQVMSAITAGECPCGAIIHEGRFTYQEKGLHKVLDLGEWWEQRYGLPLPLGVIAARRRLGRERIAALEAAICRSVRCARLKPESCRDFVRRYAQEMNEDVITRHIETFVTEFSLDLGPTGEAAVSMLARKAAALAGKDVLPELFLPDHA